MLDPVFSPSFGNRPKTLVGRESIKSQILSAIKSAPGSRERALLILGQRGSGKTVLLLEVADLAAENQYVVASPTVVSGGMCSRILEKLHAEESGKSGVHITGGGVSAFGVGGSLQFQRKDPLEGKSFAYQLDDFTGRINAQGRGVLILIDEVQAENSELRELVIAYQEMVGKGRDIMLVMAGLPGAVSTLLNDKVLTFLNRAYKLWLTPIPIREVDAYYELAFRKAGVEISTERRRQASEASFGSPYLLQLVGHHLVIAAGDQGKLTKRAFDRALSYAEEDYLNDVCKTTMDALSERDRDFLFAMARETPAEVPIAAISEGMGASSQMTQNYKRRLIQAGVIEQTRRGFVKICVPHLKTYLKKEIEENE